MESKSIEDIDCCATRLRITVTDETKVTDQYLKQSGSKGIIKKGTGIQIIYGPQVSVIKSNFLKNMWNIMHSMEQILPKKKR